jgi:hypothetical protein
MRKQMEEDTKKSVETKNLAAETADGGVLSLGTDVHQIPADSDGGTLSLGTDVHQIPFADTGAGEKAKAAAK